MTGQYGQKFTFDDDKGTTTTIEVRALQSGSVYRSTTPVMMASTTIRGRQ